MKKKDWLKKKLTDAERRSVLVRIKKDIDKKLKNCYNYVSTKKEQGVLMNEHMVDNLNEMTLDELEVFKKELGDFIKAKKEEAKKNAIDAFKATVSLGDEVLFVFKGKEHFGKVAKINEKSFTAEFDLDGEMIKKPIQFHLFVGKADESNEAMVV